MSSCYIAVMVDNPGEKVDECPLNRGHLVLFVYNWDPKKLSVIQSSGVSAVDRLLEVLK